MASMKDSQEIIIKEIDGKAIVWFKNSNQYIVLETATASILNDLLKNISRTEIASKLASEYEIPIKDAIVFVNDVATKIMAPNLRIIGSENSEQKNSIPKKPHKHLIIILMELCLKLNLKRNTNTT